VHVDDRHRSTAGLDTSIGTATRTIDCSACQFVLDHHRSGDDHNTDIGTTVNRRRDDDHASLLDDRADHDNHLAGAA
jgi:hypothetical protein